MIGRIRGILIEKQASMLLVDVQGVGYEIEASLNTIYQLPESGGEIILHTHFVVREDAQLLFGFSDVQERRLFRALIKVNGVGPKMAITLLSSIGINDFVRCVRDNDTQTLVKLPGIGKKTAERLIIEMRDKLKDWQITNLADSGSSGAPPPAGSKAQQITEAESALAALGYKPQEASKAVAAVLGENFTNSEELIRQALKSMVIS